MSWTEERMELLKKLWLDGLSASTIARELGMSMTRNAVIGKVHRMGLAGRAKSTSHLPTRPREKEMDAAMPTHASRSGVVDTALLSNMPAISGNNALALNMATMSAPVQAVAPAPKPQPIMQVVIPQSVRVTIMDLRDTMCKWPMGDPMQADFRYCGAQAPLGGSPYCDTHARVAYQPAQERRRDRDRKQLRIG